MKQRQEDIDFMNFMELIQDLKETIEETPRNYSLSDFHDLWMRNLNNMPKPERGEDEFSNFKKYYNYYLFTNHLCSHREKLEVKKEDVKQFVKHLRVVK